MTRPGDTDTIYSVEYKLSDSTIVGTECKWNQILLPNDAYSDCQDHDQARCIYTVRPQLANTNEYITRRRAREFFNWLNGMGSMGQNMAQKVSQIPPPPTPAPSTKSDDSSDDENNHDSGMSSAESINSNDQTKQTLTLEKSQ